MNPSICVAADVGCFVARLLLALTVWVAARAATVPAPEQFTATPGDTRVTISWTASPGATAYSIKRATSATGPLTNIVEAPCCEFVDLTVTNTRTYFYAISALDGAQEGLATRRLSVRPSAPILDLLPAGTSVERLSTGMIFTEGPVWNPATNGFVIWSDIDGNTLYQWTFGDSRKIFRRSSNNANGNALDALGRLLTCEHSAKRVSIRNSNGVVTSLVASFNNLQLNSPNDVVVKRDGTVWFTDPTYGGAQTQPGKYVYRYDPATSNLTAVVRDFDMPNGLCFSPDEKKLYVADSGSPHHIRVFDVLDNGTVTNSKVHFVITNGVADGMRIDPAGRLVTTSDNGIVIISTNGTYLGLIPVPEVPANLCFGGTNNEVLFITARTSLYGVTRRPDFSVTNLALSVTSPVDGDRILFSAVVRNLGTGPGNAAALRVGFKLDNGPVTFWADSAQGMPGAGGSMLVTANGGSNGPIWRAIQGAHTLSAVVDEGNVHAESLEDNNSSTTLSFTVAATPPDTDGDGSSDRDEAAAGTDPNNASSVLKIVAVQPTSIGKLSISWNSVSAKEYRLTESNVASGGIWNLVEKVTAQSAITTVEATISTSANRYFRIELGP